MSAAELVEAAAARTLARAPGLVSGITPAVSVTSAWATAKALPLGALAFVALEYGRELSGVDADDGSPLL